MRTCVGCRTTTTADHLIRVRSGPEGLLTGAGPGRGAWLCAAHPVECLERALSRKALGRALRAEISEGAVARLRATLMQAQNTAEK